VRVPGQHRARHQETQTFGTTTPSLLVLRDWLAAFGVTVVGMESTGVYKRDGVLDQDRWALSSHGSKSSPPSPLVR
jgi:hypothetical protein